MEPASRSLPLVAGKAVEGASMGIPAIREARENVTAAFRADAGPIGQSAFSTVWCVECDEKLPLNHRAARSCHRRGRNGAMEVKALDTFLSVVPFGGRNAVAITPWIA
jgi:hypothetical protein